MALIPESLIDEIQSRADIAELIGRYVPLKRAGRHFKANCPFHKEKTPSFHVNIDKQIFHCFGCGTGGNVFTFLMQHDRLSFPEAVRQLAEQVGVQVPDRAAGDDGAADKQALELLEKACVFYERTLAHPEQGKAARAYLTTRGVSDEGRKRFRLGVAPAGWTPVMTAAKSTGVGGEQLEAAGLVIKGRSGHYDRFRHRLIFPIMDVRGRVISFGGRSLDAQEPKYLNGPETAVYVKGRHLYGLAQAREAIGRGKTAIVVEGYFDAVVLSDGGVHHVVSPLGTALTTDQARLLKRYAETVVLAFDPDAAGETATLRGIDLLVEAGLQVRVAQLPQAVDPDEVLRQRGLPAFEALLAKSVGIFEFLVGIALKRHPGRTTEQRVAAARFVLPTLAKVPDAMLRTEYARQLADRLRLELPAVQEELAKAQPRGMPARAAAPAAANRRVEGPGAERLLTALVLEDPSRWAEAKQALELEDVTEPVLRQILMIVDAAAGQASPAQIISRVSADGAESLVAELVELAQSMADASGAFADCLQRVQLEARRRRVDELQRQLQAAQEAGHDADVEGLLREIQLQVKGG